MKMKILISTGILISTIVLSCVSASASTITQDTYYSDDVYFPNGQYALNYDINMGIASSTSNDYNKVIYNDVIEREIAEVKLQGTYFEDVYKFEYYEESTDQFENIDLITYYSNFYASIGTQRKYIEYDIWFADSSKINFDLYFNITDFFYKPNDYQGHSIQWTNAEEYYFAWLEEDFDINDDIGFIDYTIFQVVDDVVVPYHYKDSLVSTNAFTYYNNGTINIDAFLIETIMNRHKCYAFYINNCVLKFKDLLYYEDAISITNIYIVINIKI